MTETSDIRHVPMTSGPLMRIMLGSLAFLSTLSVALPVHAQTMAQLEARIAALENIILSCLKRNGSTLTVDGCNLRIRNGTGETHVANGLGNLILGYNKNQEDPPNIRTGSHNLVIGDEHT